MKSRTHSRTISPGESAELEELVFELVRERLLKAVGASGMWTLQFRANTDTDSLFGETISEYIARDVANQLAAPVATIEEADAPLESPETAVDTVVDDDIPNDGEIVVEHDGWMDATVPVEVVVPECALESTVEIVEHDVYDEHRMFKPRRAA